MKNQLLFLPKLLAFWLLFFTIGRILFIINSSAAYADSWSEVFSLPFMAFRLDLSAFAYLAILPFILSLINFFIRSEKWLKWLNRILLWSVWLIIIPMTLVIVGEIATYLEWNSKLSTKIFLHLAHPAEIFRTAAFSHYVIVFIYSSILILGAYFIYNKWFKKNKLELLERGILSRLWKGLSYFIVGTGILILSLRGGVQQIPVSATDGYFSKNQAVNDVSVNAAWNFFHTCYVYIKSDISEYYKNLSVEESERIKAEMYATSSDSTTIILNTTRPNIVLITFEGWSAQMIEPMGGLEGLTPNFNSICEEGVLFSEIYATGGTSETGLSSIISGYPTIAGISISTESAKCRQLPSINQSLEDVGYNSLYAFGGSMSYGNIGGYLSDVGFDQLVDEDDLDLEPAGKLGIHDEAMFPYFLSEIQKAKRPYFYGMFTQSTHSPYDIPAPEYGNYDDDGYISSMHYADEHLGKFIDEIRKLPDFDNTLVIFISDHGRPNIVNSNTYDQRFFHIPMLFWGGAIKEDKRGQQVQKIGSQADLAKTLLAQLGLNVEEYHWSKNLLNPTTKEWATCTSTLSYGLKNNSGYTVYHMFDNVLISSPYDNKDSANTDLKKCRAVLESMYREFESL